MAGSEAQQGLLTLYNGAVIAELRAALDAASEGSEAEREVIDEIVQLVEAAQERVREKFLAKIRLIA